MKIIILGASQVGGTLAENLANERNDITVIDTDAERLRELGDSGETEATARETAQRAQVELALAERDHQLAAAASELDHFRCGCRHRSGSWHHRAGAGWDLQLQLWLRLCCDGFLCSS